MTDAATHKSLIAAIEQYFEMMFDNDVGRFDQVFAPTAQLHGLRDGNLRILPAIEYRKLLASNPFPKSKKAPRQQEILLVDFASLSLRRSSKFGFGSIRSCMSTISRFTLSAARGSSPFPRGEAL